MRRCQANLQNRCRRQIDRIAHRAFDGEQWMDREVRAAMTGKTYCGNLLWQSGPPVGSPAKVIIYEGEEHGKMKWFGTDEAMECPLHDESFYNGL